MKFTARVSRSHTSLYNSHMMLSRPTCLSRHLLQLWTPNMHTIVLMRISSEGGRLIEGEHSAFQNYGPVVPGLNHRGLMVGISVAVQ
jgi:hypothetical protein